MIDSLIKSTGSAPKFTCYILSDADCMLAYSLGIIGVASGNTQFGVLPKKRRRSYQQADGCAWLACGMGRRAGATMSRADDVTPRRVERRERSGPSARSAWPPRWRVPSVACGRRGPIHTLPKTKKPFFLSYYPQNRPLRHRILLPRCLNHASLDSLRPLMLSGRIPAIRTVGVSSRRTVTGRC